MIYTKEKDSLNEAISKNDPFWMVSLKEYQIQGSYNDALRAAYKQMQIEKPNLYPYIKKPFIVLGAEYEDHLPCFVAWLKVRNNNWEAARWMNDTAGELLNEWVNTPGTSYYRYLNMFTFEADLSPYNEAILWVDIKK